MSAYRRPEIASQVFRDGSGAIIAHGARWGVDGPPEETYSVATHTERFAPLHTVADALIDHLAAVHDVDVCEDIAHAEELHHPHDDVVRAVRLAPRAADAAPLVFVFTGYPGIILRAGALWEQWFPVCGCDACDDSWESLAEELEWQVLAVAGGGFRESVSAWPRVMVAHRVTALDGSAASGGQSRVSDVPRDRLRAARAALRGLPGAWAAWPERR